MKTTWLQVENSIPQKKYRRNCLGHVDYEWFGSLTKQEVSFVTRTRPMAVYTVLERKPVNKK